MEYSVVYEGESKQNKKYIVRYPQKNDAEEMRNYVNALSLEKTFVSFQGEQISLAEETKFLESQLKRVEDKKSVHLLVFANNKLIGASSIDLKDRASSHEGVFGISIAKDYRGQGIGGKFMELIIKEAIKNLPELKIITLGVFANNLQAIKMYEDFGFIEYGRLPKGFMYKGQPIDHVYMYKEL